MIVRDIGEESGEVEDDEDDESESNEEVADQIA
jgi:hypothetical protein